MEWMNPPGSARLFHSSKKLSHKVWKNLSFRKSESAVQPKTCLIDVGGGMRGVYAAGVLDRLLDEGISVDLCIGVSAGSANLATYLARQKGRLYAYYHEYAYRREYASLSNFFKKRSFFDMDYIYGTLSNSDGEYPIDYEQMARSSSELVIVATNALTGRPVYLDKSRLAQDDYSSIKGSCAVPYLCHPWNVAGIPFCDGTVSDPIPIVKALEMGAQKIVILLPRKPEMEKEDRKTNSTLSLLEHSAYGRRYPEVAKALRRRVSVNNRSFRLARKLEEEGKVLFVSAGNLHDVSSLGGPPEKIERLYQEGYCDGEKAVRFLQSDSPAFSLKSGDPKQKESANEVGGI